MERYDSYKDSGVEWIGAIPSSWEIKKNKHISSKQKFSIVDGPFGTQLKSSEYQDYGIPLVRIVNLSFEGHFTEEGITYISESKYEEIIRSSLKIGDVIIGKTGYTIGKVGVFPFDKGSISSSCLKITPNTNMISSDLIKYIYISDGFYREVLENSKGSTRDTINIEPFSNLQLPLPPLNEQQQIVSFLDTKTSLVDSLIEKTRRKIELLKEKRTSLINEVVTKGLNPNVDLKDSGVEWIGEIPSHWFVNKVGNNTYVKGRIGWKGLRSEDFKEQGPYLITGTDFNKDGTINWDNMYHVDQWRYDEDPFIQLQDNDVLITKDGTIGKVVYVGNLKGPTCLNSGIFLTRPTNNEYKSRFFFWLLNSNVFKVFVDYNSGGSTIQHLYQNVFVNFRFPIPPLSEQQQIVEYLDEQTQKIYRTISIEERRIELLKEYRQSLISEVVTGKLKVSTDE